MNFANSLSLCSFILFFISFASLFVFFVFSGSVFLPFCFCFSFFFDFVEYFLRDCYCLSAGWFGSSGCPCCFLNSWQLSDYGFCH